MSRLTIDFGIDLGTTNSSVAVCEKNGPRILRNNEGWQFTPSAVWVNKSNALRVGMEARERAFSDPDNGALEFKLMMGRDHSVRMARLNRSYKPEELSAEVLKALKGDVQREIGEDLDAGRHCGACGFRSACLGSNPAGGPACRHHPQSPAAGAGRSRPGLWLSTGTGECFLAGV